jgi:hypothetical protein
MNSLQLVSKIRSKADDLSQNISDLLQANHSFSSLDKALLSKQCLDLYELILKLKSEAELLEEKPLAKQNFSFPTKESAPETPKNLQETPNFYQEIPVKPTPPPIVEESLVQTNNFQEVLNWADSKEESLDQISQKVDFIEPKIEEKIEPKIEAKLEAKIEQKIDLKPEPKLEPSILSEPITHEVNPISEANLHKAIENKRIQYTVMPSIEEPKAVPLHETFTSKPLSYNEKIAQTNPPVSIPLAEKTIEAPIDNIKSAINLNKKIAFVNELFKENVVEYAKAIERLNQATDRNDAFRIHNELKHLHNWDNNNELVMDLERLIKRRFA